MTPELMMLAVMEQILGILRITLVGDGKIRRFYIPGDRPGTQNGWYVLFLGRLASGIFGSWKTGERHHWHSRQPFDHREALLINTRNEQARQQREAEQQLRQQETAAQATRIWGKAAPANPNHPYLVAKGCAAHGLRQQGQMLLVPLYHDGRLVNLQRIYPDGNKRFMPGGQVKGVYSPLGKHTEATRIYICEGWATGATIQEVTGAAVACAMNAGNLLAVANHLRHSHPNHQLIVAGDDDRLTAGNPGRTAATKAAAAIGCGLIFPPWPGDEPLALTDFNDLRQWLEAQQ